MKGESRQAVPLSKSQDDTMTTHTVNTLFPADSLWCMWPERMPQILADLEAIRARGNLEAQSIELRPPFELIRNTDIGVVRIEGPITKRVSLVGHLMGFASLELFDAAVEMAVPIPMCQQFY